MKKLFVLLLFVIILLFASAAPADAAVRVRGYYRNNGTYVQPHYRSDPDGLRYNNWSYRGNYNPYTGARGYRQYWNTPRTFQRQSLRDQVSRDIGW